jgi:hypothetical protein
MQEQTLAPQPFVDELDLPDRLGNRSGLPPTRNIDFGRQMSRADDPQPFDLEYEEADGDVLRLDAPAAWQHTRPGVHGRYFDDPRATKQRLLAQTARSADAGRQGRAQRSRQKERAPRPGSAGSSPRRGNEEDGSGSGGGSGGDADGDAAEFEAEEAGGGVKSRGLLDSDFGLDLAPGTGAGAGAGDKARARELDPESGFDLDQDIANFRASSPPAAAARRQPRPGPGQAAGGGSGGFDDVTKVWGPFRRTRPAFSFPRQGRDDGDADAETGGDAYSFSDRAGYGVTPAGKPFSKVPAVNMGKVSSRSVDYSVRKEPPTFVTAANMKDGVQRRPRSADFASVTARGDGEYDARYDDEFDYRDDMLRQAGLAQKPSGPDPTSAPAPAPTSSPGEPLQQAPGFASRTPRFGADAERAATRDIAGHAVAFVPSSAGHSQRFCPARAARGASEFGGSAGEEGWEEGVEEEAGAEAGEEQRDGAARSPASRSTAPRYDFLFLCVICCLCEIYVSEIYLFI